ncbi:hypothetical protein [Micromonospora tulbaghiae]|uniref:hypothetical protein n=1 Tax=Micromonospora tulbaghiae TaxID=479978 RepID=UPI0033D509ED
MWPDDRDLPVEVEAAFGATLTADPGTWLWTDLSARLRANPISIRQNVFPTPSTCSVTLHNDDGALTPLHPGSPYWPNVDLGTPLRVRVRRAEDTFGRTASNGWGTAESGQEWTPASGAVSNYAVTSGAGRHTHAATNALRRTVLGVSLLDCEQTVDVAPSALMSGAALVTGLMFRYSNSGGDYYWLRCEFKPGGNQLMLKITRVNSTVFTDLAVLDGVAGLGYAANSYLRVRASVVGTKLALKVWNPAGPEPSGWQLTATDNTITTAGPTGVQSWVVPGNTNTLPVYAYHRNYAVRVERFAGYADQWKPAYVPTGEVGNMSSAVEVTCSGVLRRIQQGAREPESPLRRSIRGSKPLAYWPLEDGSTAEQGGAVVTTQPPLRITGTASFVDIEDSQWRGTVNLRFGTSALLNLQGGARVSAALSAATTAATRTAWSIYVVASIDYAFASGDVVVAEINTPGGTYVKWQWMYRSSGTLKEQLLAYDQNGTPTVVSEIFGVNTELHAIDFAVWQDGANIRAGYWWLDGSYVMTGSVPGTLAGITSVTLNATGTTQNTQMPFGHLAIWPTTRVPLEGGASDFSKYGIYRQYVNPPIFSYLREAAVDRLARLFAEDSVAVDVPPIPGVSVKRMGWQNDGNLIDLAQECIDVEGGVLYERGFGVAYLPRVERYNRPAALTVDLATLRRSDQTGAADVLAPVYDDQLIRNQWKVNRRDGSFVIDADPVSQRRGVYADSIDLNLVSDLDLPDQASWRVHLGGVVDMREDNVPIDLTANPDLIDGWLSCRVGSRVVRVNPPTQYRPGPLDRIVMGWTETLAPRQWVARFEPEPAQPWDVAVADGPQRVVPIGATLAASATATATTLSLATTGASGLWTTNPASFPLDLDVNGEQVTVSAITGTSSPQTATVAARSVNGVGKAHPVGAPVTVWRPAIIAL